MTEKEIWETINKMEFRIIALIERERKEEIIIKADSKSEALKIFTNNFDYKEIISITLN